jgi:esterase
MSLLAHSTVGNGPRGTLLLHGFLGSGRNLRSLQQRLSELDGSRRVMAVDLPGHGESPPPREDETLRSMAASVLETAHAAGLPPPYDVVGHSLGGRTALALADLAEPEVAAVALLDISPSPIPASLSASGAVLKKLLSVPEAAPDRRAMKEALLGTGLPAPLVDWLAMNLRADEGGGVRWRIDRAGLERLQGRVNAEDLWGVVERGGVKVLCIRGDRSPYVTADDARRLEALGAAVSTVASGHDVHVEAIAQVVTLLQRGL